MSSDLPLHELMQQMNAHSHSGEYLEVLGKKAAADWSSGEHKTLTEAVVQTVKQAQLSPEQVRRVIEFANTSAYLGEFKKEGAPHRVIDFDGGPANPAEILQDLNDGGGGSVYDRGTGDYNSPPGETKTASSKAEEELFELFGKLSSAEEHIPFENPHSEVIDLKDKLAGAADHLQAEISGLEVLYAECGDRLYHQVKQASLSEVSLGEVMQAWESVAPSEEYVKVAFTLITPRLLREGVFHHVDDMVRSVDKTAGARMPNPEHPLLLEFGDFCSVLSKLAELREARAEVRTHLGTLNNYVKTAGALPEAYRAATRGAAGVASAVHPLVDKVLGSGAAGVTKTLIEQSPNIALGTGGLIGYEHLKNSPHPVARGVRGTGNFVLKHTPGTEEHRQHEEMIRYGQ